MDVCAAIDQHHYAYTCVCSRTTSWAYGKGNRKAIPIKGSSGIFTYVHKADLKVKLAY